MNELQFMEYGLSSDFKLISNINASATSSWNSGAGFTAVGNNSTPFTGTFNGNNYTISNLFINRPTTSGVGLFGYTSGATIENVGLINVSITGQNDIGGLVGYNYSSSSIDNSYATGSVSGSSQVGGLVGRNAYLSSIDNSYAIDSVSGSEGVGGLVGGNGSSSSINNSYATGTVGGSSYNVGGLVGGNYNSSRIDNSYATGSVSGSGGAVGGLVGQNNSSSIDNSYATGNVNGSGGGVGGLVGQNISSIIDNSYATGSVSGSSGVGGLVGFNHNSSISNSYAACSVSGSYSVGGLVGYNLSSSSIDSSYAISTVNGSVYVGGLIGYDDGSNNLINNWWYNSLSQGIGNNGSNTSVGQWQEAGGASDFYNSTQAVYSSWDFNGLWKDGAGITHPTLIWHDMNNGSFIGGTKSIPFFIHNVNQLQFMGYALSDSFQLASDIDASATLSWNSDTGFTPVGNSSTPFTGTFNGNNYTISNLFINLLLTNDIGLFGKTSGSTIENVGLINANITGQNNVGTLVGYNNSSSIINTYAAGTVSGNNNVGGLVGYSKNSSSIDNSYATGSVSGSNNVGGLVGFNYNSSSIANSYATGTVIGSGYNAGGLLGGNYSSIIDNSYATGSVNGSSYVGGLVGSTYLSAIDNSYATGSVNGSSYVGGLVGFNGSSSIDNSYATGSVSGSGRSSVGGLVGINWNSSSITNSYATGSVNGSDRRVGGLVGWNGNTSSITNSYATGSVRGANYVGGLVGENTDSSSIDNNYATGSVSGNTNVGGLIGYDDGSNTLTNNWWYNSLSNGIGSYGPDTSVGHWQEAGSASDFYSSSQSVYSTWDFNGLWKDGAGVTYPTLIWQDMNNGTFIGGTEVIPFLIHNVNQLQFMDYALSDSFQLASDIDASATSGWNSSAGFTPVGNSSTPFTGTFNGDNYTISDLFINRPSTDGVGLFGWTSGSTIENVGFLDVNITGQNSVGALVGYNNNSSSIYNSYATGSVSGSNYVGGLVGYNNNSSSIDNSYVTGSVIGGGNYVGGLVGGNCNSSSIDNSYAIGSVSGGYGVGGLAGFSDYSSSVDNSYAISSVSGNGHYVGGLVGYNGFYSTINNSYATGSVSGDSYWIGGLVGENYSGSITNSYATGSVSGGSGSEGVGGLVGYNTYLSRIDNSYATGSVSSGIGSYDVGGLVGYNYLSSIANSYATGSVSGGSGSEGVGGLVGGNYYSSSLANSYATGSVSGNGNDVGGLVGYNTNSSSIDNSYAIGSVNGSNNVGGLVGLNYNSSSITNSFAVGTVTGSSNVGGLIGNDDGSNTLTNNWWYNSLSQGIGNNGSDTSVGHWQEAASVASFYSPLNPVYAIGPPGGWDFFTPTWDTYTNELPHLHWEHHLGSLNPLWLGTISSDFDTASNWSTSSIPGVGSTAIIANASNEPTLSAITTLANLLMGSGTFTQNAALTLSGDYVQSGGTYNQNAALSIGGNFSQSGGAFISNPTDTFTVANSFSLSGGTFSRSTGLGTGIDPYLIYDVYGLQGMGGFLSSSFGLANDIDASGTSNWNSGAGFTPVGISPTPFTGTFNGNSFTVSNLFIDLPTTDKVGLFGYTSGAIIENVGLINANITGYYGIGALVGFNISSRIDNSYATGSVSGNSQVGGLVGYNYSSSIDNSYATGTVSGDALIGGLVGGNYNSNIDNSYAVDSVIGYGYVGGLVGRNINSSIIANSYATGSVSGSNYYIGGLVGVNYSSSSIINSYATGSVNGNGSWAVGGLVGFNYNSGISNSYATGSVSSSSYDVGGLVGYNISSSSIVNSYATGSVSGGSNVGGLIGYDDTSNTLTNNWWYNSLSNGIGNYGPDTSVGQWQEAGGTSDFYSSTQAVYSTWDFNGLWKDGAGVAYPTLVWQGMNNGSFIGGTETIPFLIHNVNQLQFMGYALNDSFQLDSDIDASATSSWNSSAGFIPIGNNSTPFTGTFNGNNYTISDLFINLPSTNDVGLFGQTSGATIENVGLVNVNITGQENVGGLVGYNRYSSSIDNSYATGSVIGSSYVGGLVGNNSNSSIDNSYATGNVSGSSEYVGGLVGLNNNSSSITNSYASGNVSGGSGSGDVGGLVGGNYNSSSIDNSYAAGSVSGSGYYVGGLVGLNFNSSSIDNSYATGSVSGRVVVGGLVGYNGASSSIDNSYTTNSISSNSGEVGGLVGLNNYSSSITNSYATGSVSGSGSDVGGLVGWNENSSSITNSFATGTSSGGSNVGGLVGLNSSSTITNSYYTDSGNVNGLGTYDSNGASDFYSPANPVYAIGTAGGWDIFTPIWDTYTDQLPHLHWEHHSGSLNPLWLGTISSDFDTASNWSTNSVPGVDSTVIIANASNEPTLSSITTLADLLMGSGTFTQDAALTLTGNYAQAGGIYNQNADLSIGGNFFQGGGTFVSNPVNIFTVGNSFSLSGGIFSRFTGLGTGIDPYFIYDVYGLQGMGGFLLSTFGLANDIDASGTSNWNSGAGFIPVGNSSTPFSGSFNGNNYTISDLFINLPTTNDVGLFGYTSGATIENVGLLNANITGEYHVGDLVGYSNNSSSIANSYATGSVSGIDGVGGLVGYNYNSSSIDNSYATGSVSGTGNVGGLVGYNYSSSIANSYATGNVSGSGDVGGLVGYNGKSSIDNSYATGSVSGNGYQIGGLVGYNDSSSSIANSYANGTVNGGYQVGGLVGLNYNSSSIDNSYATGSVSGSSYVGGLVGFNGNSSSIDHSYATGSVSGSSYVGGLVGYNTNSSSIDNSYATGSVSGSNNVGGLIGYDDGTNTLTNNWWYNSLSNGIGNYGPNVSVGHWQEVGSASDFFNQAQAVYNGTSPWDISSTTGHIWAMSGDNDAFPLLQFRYSTTISDDYQLQLMFLNLGASYTLANNIDASETSNWNAGGGFAPIGISFPFTGTFNGNNYTVSNLFINLPRTDDVGLFGQTSGATIENVGLTSANITGANYVGGIVGFNNSSSIDNSYAIGSVSGSGNGIGGLVGRNNSSSIDNSYASGSVSGANYVGGLVGYNGISSIDNSYTTGSVSGINRVGGLVGYNGYSSSIDNSYATDSVSGGGCVGGLVGGMWENSTISNSFYDIDSVSINGGHLVTMGGIYDSQYQDWMNHGKFLMIDNYLTLSGGYYQISNVNDLKNFLGFSESNDNTDKFELTNNLDLTGFAGLYIPYLGVEEFNGNSKTISNLSIDLPNNVDIGFFGYAQGSNIHDLGIVSGSVTGSNVGALVGINDHTSINNSYATVSVTGSGYVGGLVGDNSSSIIDNSYATGNVSGNGNGVGGLVGYNTNSSNIDNSYATGKVSGGNYVGGLVGYNFASTIANSYATGSVSGGSYVGGLVSSNGYSSSIANSYATGSVSGSSNVGGLIGYDDGTNTLTNNWWYNSLSQGIGNNASDTNVGHWQEAGSASDFFNQAQAVYNGTNPWDFINTWVATGLTYPDLLFTYDIWSGSGSWSNAANWSKDIVPTQTSKVLFNATSLNDSTIDAFGGDIASLVITSGYTGSIAQNNDLTITGSYVQGGGTFNQNTNLSINGSYVNNGGTFNAGSQPVTFTGSGTINSGSTLFNNLNVNASGTYTLADALSVNDNLNIQAGELDANGQMDMVTGLTTISGGTYSASTATQTFSGGLTISGGIFSGSGGDVSTTDLTLSSGTLTAPSGNFDVSGAWDRIGGTFDPGTYTVTLDGTDQTISGNTTFYNLTKTVSSADTLTFEAGSTQTIEHTLTLQGASGNLLSLRSSSNGTAWNIDPQGTKNIGDVDAKDSDNINATVISPHTSIDSGNNTSWSFGYLAVTGASPMTAGTTDDLVITSYDDYGAVNTSYAGAKGLTFSGISNAITGQIPTVAGIDIGSLTDVDFTAGVSNNGAATLKAYKAETASVGVTDGNLNATGHTLSLTVNPASANSLTLSAVTTTPNAGSTDQLTLTAYDLYDNIATGYTGAESGYIFSGVNSISSYIPTVTDNSGTPVDFGTPETLTFSNGVSSLGGNMTLYKAETASVTATQGSLTSNALGLTVAPLSVSSLTLSAASTTPVTGSTDQLTITAKDMYGNTATSYSGDEANFTFSGANSIGLYVPTVTDKTGTAIDFGTPETLTFLNGVSSAGGLMTLYDVETALVTATQGSLTSNALSVTVTPPIPLPVALINQFTQLEDNDQASSNGSKTNNDEGGINSWIIVHPLKTPDIFISGLPYQNQKENLIFSAYTHDSHILQAGQAIEVQDAVELVPYETEMPNFNLIMPISLRNDRNVLQVSQADEAQDGIG